MKIKFLGAAGTVTGSCYLLTSESGQSVLIDCGLFQGSNELEDLNIKKLECNCSQVEGLILTHAHLDHCGRLPTLLRQGFTKNIYMTAPTQDLTEISLLDSAKIGKEDHHRTPLFTQEEAERTFELFKIVEYDKKFTVGCFEVIMRDAGHILGSASLEIVDATATNSPKKIVFSGDLGNSPQDIIRPTELIDSADIVVMESTYGDKDHPADSHLDIIQREVNAIEKSGGTLLIPSFSIERAQELLHIIYHLKKEKKVKEETQVFLDSPMADKTTAVFEKYKQYFNDEVKKDLLTGDPLDFPGLTHVKHGRDSAKLDSMTEPKVILSGSGMMTGGRILLHAQHYLPIETTRLLIVGYQAESTLGRRILEGDQDVNIQGLHVHIDATISETQSMSSHAGQTQLMSWLKNIKGVKKIFLTHGEDMQRGVLAEKIKAELNLQNVETPHLNEELSA